MNTMNNPNIYGKRNGNLRYGNAYYFGWLSLFW